MAELRLGKEEIQYLVKIVLQSPGDLPLAMIQVFERRLMLTMVDNFTLILKEYLKEIESRTIDKGREG